MSTDSPEAPDAVYVRQRWIPNHTVDWVRDCDRIMLEHGAVSGSVVYPNRYQARYRAKKLIRLMVELRLHDQWELVEHTARKDGGWIWTVEHRRRS